MEKPPGTRRRVGSLSRIACAACRHLKMRCIGAEKPPCARCAKSGRFCILPQSKQQQQQQQIPSEFRHMQHASENSSLSSAQALRFVPNYPEKQHHAAHRIRHTSKPSISRSFTTPVSTTTLSFQSVVAEGRRPSLFSSTPNVSAIPALDLPATGPTHTRLRSDFVDCAPSSGHSHNGDSHGIRSLPSDEEMCHLSSFFIMNLLPQIPILADIDVADFSATYKFRRPLSYAMTYVGARFVPGCKVIRTMLTPTIVSMARLQFDRLGDVQSTDEDCWVLLQALAILYTWAPRQFSNLGISDGDYQPELQQEMLRASIETLALRFSLHKSAEEVADLLKRGTENIQQTFAFRKYLYWLWLFSEAHFRSLVSQTPPSIREDATITQAVQLLESMAADNSVRRILARVELCLLWVRVGLRERSLGEWWCSVYTQVNLDSMLTLLDDLDMATQRWRQKWQSPEKSAPVDYTTKSGREGTIDFYYHFTCFCISTYVARAFRTSILAESLPLSRTNLLAKTIERGYAFCQFSLELSPLAKTSVCFGPEIIFAMIAACCEYLLQIYSSPDESALVLLCHLSTVRGVAELMLDLSVDDRHSARIHGQQILAKLNTARPTEKSQKAQKPERAKAHHSRSLTWTAGSNEHPPTQPLLSFAATADDTLQVQEALDQRELSNGHNHGLNTGAGEGVGLWASYDGVEALGSGNPYWTT